MQLFFSIRPSLLILVAMTTLAGCSSESENELANKPEYSFIQNLERRQSKPDNNRIEIVRGSPNGSNYDAVGLPTVDGDGVVWLLTNASSIPRIKVSNNLIPRAISEDELEVIRSSLSLNAEVEILLRYLVRKE
jgi:hypothetical protein